MDEPQLPFDVVVMPFPFMDRATAKKPALVLSSDL
jgi:hypothetical protein